METNNKNQKSKTDELSEKKQQLKKLQEDIEVLEDETYEQHISWDADVLGEISDILSDPKVTDLIIYDQSYDDYLERIVTKKSLKNIVEKLQQYYNQVKEDDRRGTFYIETVSITKISTNKYELIFSHGT